MAASLSAIYVRVMCMHGSAALYRNDDAAAAAADEEDDDD